jgi:tetratricopeptide (TPR) repeat protein
VLADYLQFCRFAGQVSFEPTRALDFAQKVVAAAPDFSWGWSAISESANMANSGWSSGSEGQSLRALGLQAADKALELDPTNSEALGDKSQLIDRAKLVEREQLLKRALAARPLSCGCEHFLYGSMLTEVGRFADATVQMRRAIELNPMDQFAQWSFGDLLLTSGKKAEAKPHLDTAVDVSNRPGMANNITVGEALLTGDVPGALNVLRDPANDFPPAERAALIAGFEAVRTKDPTVRAEAIRLLTAASFDGDKLVASILLGALGANVEALKVVSDEAAANSWAARSWLFYPSMRPALSDPSFPAVAEKLGLMKYWKVTHTRPDVCSVQGPRPPFCKMI